MSCYFLKLTNEEKIIHLLYAADYIDLYDQAIEECINKFGIESTDIAVRIYETYYRVKR